MFPRLVRKISIFENIYKNFLAADSLIASIAICAPCLLSDSFCRFSFEIGLGACCPGKSASILCFFPSTELFTCKTGRGVFL